MTAPTPTISEALTEQLATIAYVARMNDLDNLPETIAVNALRLFKPLVDLAMATATLRQTVATGDHEYIPLAMELLIDASDRAVQFIDDTIRASTT